MTVQIALEEVQDLFIKVLENKDDEKIRNYDNLVDQHFYISTFILSNVILIGRILVILIRFMQDPIGEDDEVAIEGGG